MYIGRPVILVLDDEPGIVQEISTLIADEEPNWLVKTFISGERALEYFLEKKVDCAIIDLQLPGINGMEVLRRMKEVHPQTPVLMLTGKGYNVENAIEAIQLGALNFLDKPVSAAPLIQHLRNALELTNLLMSNRKLRRISLDSLGMVGRGPQMEQLFYLVERYLDLEHPILITGETGTGKSLLAQAVHKLSKRSEQPFYTIDCSLFSDELFVAEVFGSAKGAYTGSVKHKMGKVEMAAGGTLFLDEIQDLSLSNQGRLRRFIEERKFTRLGELQEQEVDTRIIMAANQDLESMVTQGEFLKDFYMRISTFQLTLPSLKERLEDIPRLADHFLEQERLNGHCRFSGFTSQGYHFLQSLNYPGNLRTLQGLIQRTVALAEYSSDKQLIDEHDIHLAWSLQNGNNSRDNRILESNYNVRLEEFKKEMIVSALRMHEFSLTRAAKYLGLTVDNLSHKVKRLGLDVAAMKREFFQGVE